MTEQQFNRNGYNANTILQVDGENHFICIVDFESGIFSLCANGRDYDDLIFVHYSACDYMEYEDELPEMQPLEYNDWYSRSELVYGVRMAKQLA